MRSSSSFHRRRLTTALLAVLAVGRLITTVQAIDPARALSKYLRTRWEGSSGFPGGAVYAITQTEDGYLWVAAEKGIVRFDGLTFRLFQPKEATAGTDPVALQIAPAPGGALWARLRRSIFGRYHNGQYEAVPRDVLWLATAMAPAKDEAMLVADVRLGVVLVRQDRVQTVLAASSLPRSPVISVAQTPSGDVWIGTRDDGLVHAQGARAVQVTEGLPDQKINCLVPDGADRLWIGTDGGIARWDGQGLTRTGLPPALDRVRVITMIQDRDNNLWIGTAEGLWRLTRDGTAVLERLQGAGVTALFEDHDGNLWIGTPTGLERWRDGAFTTYPEIGLATGANAGPVFVDAADRVWFAPTSGGLYWMRDGRVDQVVLSGLNRDVIYSLAGSGGDVWIGRQRGGLTHLRAQGQAFTTETFTHENGLAQDYVYSVHRSRTGAVWAGTLSGGASRLKDGVFTTYTVADGLASNTVAAVLEATDGTMWFATPNGASTLSSRGWRRYSTADGLPSNDVNTLFEDSVHTVWLGTAAGLALVRDGRLQSDVSLPDALRGSIVGIGEDAKGWLWIATADHVLRVDRRALLQGPLAEGVVREYDGADGLLGIEGVKRHRTLTLDSRGRIWLSTNGGLSMVDPVRVAGRSGPALAQIDEVSADGIPVAGAGEISIPPRPQRITLTFTALSLSVPERVRFRYRLDGFDHDWSPPVSSRQAVYTNLGPGRYRFRLIASNSDGAWNGSEVVSAFTIAPAFWETKWFYVTLASGLAALIVGVAWGTHRIRLRLVERREREISALNEQLMKAQEQERIRIAGELHDGVMQQMLAVTMMLGTAKRRIADNPEAAATIDKVQEKLVQTGAEIRQLSHDLHPPALQDAGLPQAVRTYCEQFSAASGIPVSCEADDSVHELSRGAALALFRIMQEALGNAAKHAAPSSIAVRLTRAGGLVSLVVADDGAGFDGSRLTTSGGLGLIMMRERAGQLNGKFEFESERGKGTTISVAIPFR